MPYGIDQGDWFDRSINLRAWCEVLTWFPAALLTSPGVRRDPIDEDTAILTMPFANRATAAPGSSALWFASTRRPARWSNSLLHKFVH